MAQDKPDFLETKVSKAAPALVAEAVVAPDWVGLEQTPMRA